VTARGQKPKPVVDKLIRGNPGKRGLTTLVPPPKGGALICPVHVAGNDRARGYWDHYLANAAPGHLAPIDSPLLARLCMTLARADKAEQQLGDQLTIVSPKSGMNLQSPLMAIINRQTELAVKLCAQLSLPPAERNRLGIHGYGSEAADPGEKYFQSLGAEKYFRR
jgi:phage terminase small subunit